MVELKARCVSGLVIALLTQNLGKLFICQHPRLLESKEGTPDFNKDGAIVGNA